MTPYSTFGDAREIWGTEPIHHKCLVLSRGAHECIRPSTELDSFTTHLNFHNAIMILDFVWIKANMLLEGNFNFPIQYYITG